MLGTGRRRAGMANSSLGRGLYSAAPEHAAAGSGGATIGRGRQGRALLHRWRRQAARRNPFVGPEYDEAALGIRTGQGERSFLGREGLKNPPAAFEFKKNCSPKIQLKAERPFHRAEPPRTLGSRLSRAPRTRTPAAAHRGRSDAPRAGAAVARGVEATRAHQAAAGVEDVRREGDVLGPGGGARRGPARAAGSARRAR